MIMIFINKMLWEVAHYNKQILVAKTHYAIYFKTTIHQQIQRARTACFRTIAHPSCACIVVDFNQAQFLGKAIMKGVEECPAVPTSTAEGRLYSRLLFWVLAASWGNSPGVRAESASRKRQSRRGRRSHTKTADLESARVTETVPSNSRRLSKVMPLRTQRGSLLSLTLKLPCAWSCLVVGWGFKPQGA